MAGATAKVRRRLPAVAVLFALVLALGVGSTMTALASHSSSTVSTGPSASMETEFLNLLNRARSSNGLSSLRRVEGVNNVAREWAHVMAVDNQLKHRLSLRAPFDGSWRLLGENVGVGDGADSLHRSFMNSPGHRANIMGDYDYVGIGVALAGSRAWVAFNFVKGDPSTRSTYRTNPLAGQYATGAGNGGPFFDIRGNTHENPIKQLDGAGVAISCASGRFCPLDDLRRAEMAALLTHALNLRPAQEQFRDVASSHIYADEIGALAAAGITVGCNPPANDRFCPEEPVTRSQMASFFVRALNLYQPPSAPFTDVDSSNVHRRAIGALARSGITVGCNPPSNSRYCPFDPVTRGQMSSFIVRGIDL